MNDSIGMNYCAPDANVWAVNLDGRYMSAVQNYLVADGIPTDGVTKIVSNAAQTLSYCPDPEGIGKCQKTGIVIGKVQSGKTSNFISITALAFDNDYDIVIVLGGTKKPLVKQNRDRIKEYFSTTKDVLVLDTTDFKDQLTAQKMHQFRKMNKKVVIVALKSPAQINYIADNIFFDSVLAEKPILIIDDEGDEASLNTLVKKGKKSSTYKAIENLKERLDRHCFLSITATPQANLLIDTLDVLSPDFGILVDPGKGYCGLDVYHSDTTYTRKIPDFAGRLYLFRFQLEENLMGALVGKGKSALGAEPLHVSGSNEALVQDDLITLQSQCARNTKFRDLVLSVGIGSDTADASVRRETGE